MLHDLSGLRGRCGRREKVFGVEALTGLSTIAVVPGVSVDVLKMEEGDDVTIGFESSKGNIEFNFVLSGQAQASSRWKNSTHCLTMKSGETLTFCSQEGRGTFSLKRNEQVRMLGIKIALPVLESLVPEETANMLPQLLVANHLKSKTKSRMAPLQKVAAIQLLNCSVNEAAAQLFLQGKVFEILAYEIDALMERFVGQRAVEKSAALMPADVERIRHAREILKAQMADPPRLQELATQVGLNITKLKKGFRFVFDKTPYECLRCDRMQRAHALLCERNHNVSEVAWEVGYVNVGHFSVAFQNSFGVKPKAFQLALNKHSSA